MSENRQFVENPLLLTDLFPKGVFHFGEGEKGQGQPMQMIGNELETKSQELVEEASLQSEIPPAQQKEEIEKLPETDPNPEEMITLTIVNLLFDSCDANWDVATKSSYDKLMSAVKVNQESVIAEDIEVLRVIGEKGFSPALLGDRLSPVIFVWTDQDMAEIPALYKARPTEKGVILHFPAFSTMCGDVEMKKMVWQTMKQVLKF